MYKSLYIYKYYNYIYFFLWWMTIVFFFWKRKINIKYIGFFFRFHIVVLKSYRPVAFKIFFLRFLFYFFSLKAAGLQLLSFFFSFFILFFSLKAAGLLRFLFFFSFLFYFFP